MGAFRLFPGLTPDLLRNVLQPPLQGLVLEAYGVGNGPDRDAALLAALAEAASRGVVIVPSPNICAGPSTWANMPPALRWRGRA